MRAHVFINGYLVGALDYEHPKDSHGRAVVLPQKCRCEEHPCKCNEVAVQITDGDDHGWFAFTRLEALR